MNRITPRGTQQACETRSLSRLLGLQTASVIAALLLLASAAVAQDTYVDAVAGSDTSGDGSEAAPYRTITRALTDVGGGPGEILIAPGVYDASNGEMFPLVVPNPVHLHGPKIGVAEVRSEGSTAFLLTAEVPPCDTLLEHLEIDGFDGASRGGIGIETCGAVIRNNVIRGFNLAIYADVSVGTGGPSSSAAHTGGSILANTIHSNDTAISLSAEQVGTVDGLELNLELHNNVIASNDLGVELFASCPAGDCGLKNLLAADIRNNTFYDNGGDALLIEILAGDIDPAVNVVNNVFALSGRFAINDSDVDPDLISANDFYMNTAGPYVTGVGDAGDNLTDAPGFVAPASGDFHLEDSSPLIDAGNNDGAPVLDRDGNSRPIDGDGDLDAVVDIGAFEHPAAFVPQPLRRADFSTLDPLMPTKSDVFPFGPSNPLTPSIDDVFESGSSDPEMGILTRMDVPMAFYQFDDAAVLLAVKDVMAGSLTFTLR